MSNVRTRAIRDWRRLSVSAFNLELTFTAPDATTATAKGMGTNRHLLMISDGQDVNTRMVHIAISEAELLASNANYPTRDGQDYVDLVGHRVSFQDARGTVLNYRITEHMPDDTVGMIMCTCEYYSA